MTQLSDSFTFSFEQLRAVVDANNADAAARFEAIESYVRVTADGLELGTGDGAIQLILMPDKISFRRNGAEFGWWDGVDFHTGNIVIEVNERAQFGDFAFIPRTNGSLDFKKVGG